MDTPSGVLKKGTVLLTEDKGLMLSASEDVKVKDAQGKPVDKISIKQVDKHYDGREHDAALGKTFYIGEPDGARFEPAVKITLKLPKENLPPSYKPESPMLGYYDEKTDLWRTYPNQEFSEDDKYYYYSASVNHFTPISVVACGQEQFVNTWRIEVSPFRHLIEPTAEQVWLQNKKGPEESMYAWKVGDEVKDDFEQGYHLIPEVMGIAECKAEEDMEYNAQHILGQEKDEYKQKICTEQGLLRDWDNDDDPDKSKYEKHSYSFYVYDPILGPMRNDVEFYIKNKNQKISNLNFDFKEDYKGKTFVNVLEGDYYTTSLYDINNPNGYILYSKCYEACVEKAEQDIKYYFKGEELPDRSSDIAATSIQPLPEELRFDPSNYISGDGIRDGQHLHCYFKIENSIYHAGEIHYNSLNSLVRDLVDKRTINDFVIKYTLSENDVECLVLKDRDNLNNDNLERLGYNIEILKSLNADGKQEQIRTIIPMRTMSLELDKRFYATPMTYGYGKLPDDSNEDELSEEQGHVGGVGYFKFEFDTNGNGCVQTGGKEAAISEYEAKLIKNSEGKKFDSTNFQHDLDCNSDSSDSSDSCKWSLNPEPTDYEKNNNLFTYSSANTQGQLHSGLNVLKVRVDNKGENKDFFAKPEDFYFEIRGKGIRNRRACDTTVSERINYLLGCKTNQQDPLEPTHGTREDRELQCLYAYEKLDEQNNPYKKLCDVDFKQITSLSYCSEFDYSMNLAATEGGKCNGETKICPSVIASTYDVGCMCGETIFEQSMITQDSTSQVFAYCCDNFLYKPDGTRFDGSGESLDIINFRGCEDDRISKNFKWDFSGGSFPRKDEPCSSMNTGRTIFTNQECLVCSYFPNGNKWNEQQTPTDGCPCQAFELGDEIFFQYICMRCEKEGEEFRWKKYIIDNGICSTTAITPEILPCLEGKTKIYNNKCFRCEKVQEILSWQEQQKVNNKCPCSSNEEFTVICDRYSDEYKSSTCYQCINDNGNYIWSLITEQQSGSAETQEQPQSVNRDLLGKPCSNVLYTIISNDNCLKCTKDSSGNIWVNEGDQENCECHQNQLGEWIYDGGKYYKCENRNEKKLWINKDLLEYKLNDEIDNAEIINQQTLTQTQNQQQEQTPQSSTDTAPSPTINTITAVVRTGDERLNLRNGPGFKYPIITQLSSGTNIEIIGKYPLPVDGYEWVKVKFDSTEGWVALKYLTFVNQINANTLKNYCNYNRNVLSPKNFAQDLNMKGI